MLELISDLWPYLVASLNLVVSSVASGHAVIFKRDLRASIGWVGVIWLVPFVGAFLYLTLGINRIRRRAQALRADQPLPQVAMAAYTRTRDATLEALGVDGAHLDGLVRLVETVTDRPLLPGHRILALSNGDEAYPAMLGAIGSAQRSIALSSYIFNDDRAGQLFVAALEAAVSRGVEVRVLVDDVGRRYSWRSVTRKLETAGIRYAKFLPTLVPRRFFQSNLRNHRKILVVDGETGFTGGMNIHEKNCLELATRRPTQDLHFRVTGPGVAHLQEAFAVDWSFSTGERLEGKTWFPSIEPDGPALARGISDGPDEELDRLRWTILGALSCAKRSVTVVTPYFLPDTALIAELSVAAMRGVEVRIVLPEKSNITLVDWASRAIWWQLLEHDCQIWLSPAPFDHTKLLLVDGIWVLLGSTNWDARSLRLNFEFNLECYDRELVTRLAGMVDEKLERSRRVSLAEVHRRGLPVKLRDGVARLFSPYL